MDIDNTSRMVLMRLTPSPPPASTAFAISTISVTFGESFTITGLSVTLRTAFVTCSTTFGSIPSFYAFAGNIWARYIKLQGLQYHLQIDFCHPRKFSTVPADIFASNGTSYFLRSGKISGNKMFCPLDFQV